MFMFLPLIIFLVKEKHERKFLVITVAVLLLCRLVAPLVDAPIKIVFAGLGGAMFIIFVAYAQSVRYRYLAGNLVIASGMAVLLAVAFRSWGSSLDISIDVMPLALGNPLVVIGGVLFYFLNSSTMDNSCLPETILHSRYQYVGALGFFSCLAFIYLFLSCPDVARAWMGYSRMDNSSVIYAFSMCVSILIVTAFSHKRRCKNKTLLIIWNLIFTGLVVFILWSLKPSLPLAATSSQEISGSDYPDIKILVIGIFIFCGVVLLNLKYSANMSFGKSPKNTIIPIVCGMIFLFSVTLLLIAVNIWGYIPLGACVRNHFYLPFLIAGMGMTTPWVLQRFPGDICDRSRLGHEILLIILLCCLVLVGELWRRSQSVAMAVEENTLTVLTYNMQQGSHEYGRRNYTEQCAFLRGINADIVGLQECDTARPSGGNVDAVRYFAESLHYDYVYYGPNTVSGTFGTAILSRYPLNNARTIFTFSDTDEIGTACCEIKAFRKTIAFFCCHPAGGYDAKDAFATTLLSEAATYQHVIAIGDFNFREKSPHYKKVTSILSSSAKQLGKDKVNFHDGNTSLTRKIDHIFISDGFHVLESHYLPPPMSQTDHPAHWSVIKLK